MPLIIQSSKCATPQLRHHSIHDPKLVEKMPEIQEKFPTYNQFALAGIEEILGEDKIEEGIHKKITGMSHQVLWNKADGWQLERLPEECQIAPLKSIFAYDLNKDGVVEFITSE